MEGDKSYGMLVNCDRELILLVLADKAIKQGLLLLQTKRFIRKIIPLLSPSQTENSLNNNLLQALQDIFVAST